MQPTVAPERLQIEETNEQDDPDRPWLVIVWNDPINLMSYVTWVFQKLFGYSKSKATKLMLDVHQKGRGSSPAAAARRQSSTASGFTATACGPPCPRATDARIRLGGRRGAPASLDADERSLLLGLLDEMQALLGEPGLADPVSQRLFPDAYDNETQATAFHELVGNELRDNKVRAVRTMKERIKGKGPLETSIPEDEVLRLADRHNRPAAGDRYPHRCDRGDDERRPRPRGSGWPRRHSVLHWLGWLQESILAEISD